jgi:hypothetical protein
MSFVFTFNTIVEKVVEEVQRRDDQFISNIPVFITLAIVSLSRKLHILGTKKFYSGTLIAGEPYYPKPNLWLSNTNFAIQYRDPLTAGGTTFNSTKQLKQRSIEYCWKYAPNPQEVGEPKYYASDYNYEFYAVVPTPDQNYPFTVGYYAFPDGLDATQQTNFFTLYAPDAFYYEILVHAGIYVEDQRLNMWKAQAAEAVASISAEDIGRINDAVSTRGA